MRIPPAPWEPDRAELDSSVAAVATNVYPGLNSYVPVKGPSAYSSALPAAPTGLWLAQKADGSFIVLAGTASNLYLLDSGTLAFTSIGSGYSVPADELWSGTQFGSKFYCTNINDGLQVYDIQAGGSFGAASGSPPTGRIVVPIEGHLWILGLDSDPAGGQWSATEDATGWTPGTGNSDVFSFKDGGRIMAAAPAAKLIIQERAVRRIIHQPGDSITFTFSKVEDAKGTIAPYSVIPFGSAVAYLAEDGFWFNGQPIGTDRVNSYFLGRANQSRLFSVLGTYDPVRPLFYWAYRTGSGATYDQMLVYNWKTDRWSEVSIDLYIVSYLATPGTTLEGLDASYPDLDVDVPYSLDSRVWLGGRPVFAVIGSDLKLSFFEGSNLEATVETGERQLSPGKKTFVNSVRPLCDASGAVVRVGKRDRLADSRTWGTEASMNTSGHCPVRSNGRYHRFRTRIPAGQIWTHWQGVEAEGATTGKR